MFGLAHRLVKDRALAEEVAQEVFLRLWRRPDRFDPARGCLRSFLLADCRGRAIDAIRAETARRRREERDGRSSGLHVVDDVADRICDRAVRADVGLLLEALPEVERAAISLACATSVTYREVAATLGIPEGTAKARIRSGLRRMRAQIEDVSTNEATR